MAAPRLTFLLDLPFELLALTGVLDRRREARRAHEQAADSARRADSPELASGRGVDL